MQQGIFESLTGCFLDGTPLESIGYSERRVYSVMDHLSRMFNTRVGSISYLPDYGLPDISEVYRTLPDGLENLRDAIRCTVEKYEPRLVNVRVQYQEPESGRQRIVFIINGQIKGGGQVRFQTTFTGTGNSSVSPFRKKE